MLVCLFVCFHLLLLLHPEASLTSVPSSTAPKDLPEIFLRPLGHESERRQKHAIYWWRIDPRTLHITPSLADHHHSLIHSAQLQIDYIYSAIFSFACFASLFCIGPHTRGESLLASRAHGAGFYELYLPRPSHRSSNLDLDPPAFLQIALSVVFSTLTTWGKGRFISGSYATTLQCCRHQPFLFYLQF